MSFRIRPIAAALLLVACAWPHQTTTPDARWQVAFTPDSSLSFLVPPGYEPRNRFSCWTRKEAGWPVAADFCLERVRRDRVDREWAVWRRPCEGSAIGAEAACYHGLIVDTLDRAIPQSIVLRGLFSGKLEPYERRPAILVSVPIDRGDYALLTGEYRYAENYEELLAVARTIRIFNTR
jgi:hypothetical protein